VSEIFVVMSNAEPGQDEEFNDWYTNRHLVDLLNMDGVEAAQRFQFALPGPSGAEPEFRYLCVYEVEDGMRESVNQALRDAAAERPVAIEEGREPKVPRSPAMAGRSLSFWATPITGRRTREEVAR
jgi:hypothetical protein